MMLKEFCCVQGWTKGFAEVRRAITANAIIINGMVATDANAEVFPGDIVTFGKHKSAEVMQ